MASISGSGVHTRPPFDRAHLSTFTSGDMALERDILEHFCTNSQVHIDNLIAAIGTAKWNENAHRLKGAASGVGMLEMAKLCAQAETLEFQNVDVARQIIAAIQAELSALIDYVHGN
ncbi:MAG: Hpt domain-containing protein [Pseudomonadota bacterium]